MSDDAPGGAAADPASADPRAFRARDADGRPLAVFVGDDGYARISIGGEQARLDPHQAHQLGARIMGAGHRASSQRLTARPATA